MQRDPITCRYCGSTECEHGDHCAECGCPKCGYPGARASDPTGVRGFCPECEWEIRPGAFQAWKARQPKLTSDQMFREIMTMLGGADQLPPTDEVGGPIFNVGDHD